MGDVIEIYGEAVVHICSVIMAIIMMAVSAVQYRDIIVVMIKKCLG